MIFHMMIDTKDPNIITLYYKSEILNATLSDTFVYLRESDFKSWVKEKLEEIQKFERIEIAKRKQENEEVKS